MVFRLEISEIMAEYSIDMTLTVAQRMPRGPTRSLLESDGGLIVFKTVDL